MPEPGWALVFAGWLLTTTLLSAHPESQRPVGIVPLRSVLSPDKGSAARNGGSERSPAPPPDLPDRVDPIRSWSARELRSLPGIGQTRALSIVRARWEGRLTGGLDDLDSISGIGPVTVRAIRAYLHELENAR